MAGRDGCAAAAAPRRPGEAYAPRAPPSPLVGYGAVAINHTVEGKLPKSVHRRRAPPPTPQTCPFGRIEYSSPPGERQPLRQYSRLTLVLSDPQQNYGINGGGDVIRSYDIIAVQPESERMFQTACTSLEVDLITLDLSVRLPFPIKAGFLRQALDRGVSFEILYAPIVAEVGARRNAIGNTRTLLRLGLRGRKGSAAGLVLSSGATAVWQLRAPQDVLNLAGLLGIAADARKGCLAAVPASVLMHASTRKHTFKAALAIVPPPAEPADHRATDMLEDFIELK